MSGSIGRSKLFEQDSGDYDILAEAVALAPAEGLFLEIGLRRGGGMKVILDGLVQRGIKANVISIDCYGHMPYFVREGRRDDFDYTNVMRNETLPGIYDYILDKGINFLFFNMTDTQFFEHFAGGVPLYVDKREAVINRYGLVHIDAQHTLEAVLKAARFILNGRQMAGTCICCDDVTAYDHGQVEQILLANGYKLLRKGGAKALYRLGD